MLINFLRFSSAGVITSHVDNISMNVKAPTGFLAKATDNWVLILAGLRPGPRRIVSSKKPQVSSLESAFLAV